MAYHFFAYLSRMRSIIRWGLMRNNHPENVQEHSHQTAVIAHALALINNRVFRGNVDADLVLALAVYHEAGEVITGDLPTPIKYFNPQIKKAYKEIEAVAENKLLAMLPEELKDVYRPLVIQQDSEEKKLVKAADRICAYIKCLDEVNAGNREFIRAKDSIGKELEESTLPEVHYFMKNFMESFSLTLDELN